MPELSFGVVDADILPFAAGPTMIFKLRVQNAVPDEQIHSIMLRTQIRIEATRRHYNAATEARLLELFGEPHRWGETLRSLLWTQTTTLVPPFSDSAVVELLVACTYDFEVAGAKYFYALEDDEVPLLFLFSGTIFYAGEAGLQIGQIPWEKEAAFRLPIAVWKGMMDRYFPNSAWLRLHKDVFDRLYSFKGRMALPTWDAAIERLLQTSEAELER
jgi:hypothetical protein